MIILLFIFFILFDRNYFYLIDNPYVEGRWILRRTNDKKIENTFSFLDIYQNNIVKIKTIRNGIINTKISRTGFISFIKKKNTFINKFINEIDNEYDIIIIVNNVNSYSYSILGLEIPQIRYQQNTNYNVIKRINVKQKKNIMYIVDLDNKNYYLFDLNTNNIKLPYIEISITTLILTELFDSFIKFIINYKK